MKKNQNFTVQKWSISGVKQPLLHIIGTFLAPNLRFEFFIDEKRVEPKEEMISDSLFFEYQVVFPKDSKDIKVFLIKNKDRFLVYHTKTYSWKRAVSKVHGIVQYRLERKNRWKNYYQPMIQKDYLKWVKEQPSIKVEPLKYEPLISIVTPVYNVLPSYLDECVSSVLQQSYSNFQLILVDDCSTRMDTKDCLKAYEHKDPRIQVVYREKNGNISEATNTGFSYCKGEYIGLVDNDDVLSCHALYEMVYQINKNPKVDFLYSDEDKIDEQGLFCTPYFKSDFAPDTLLSNNYICHFTVFKKSLLEQVGYERSEFDGAQDYDLFLRLTEQAQWICHVPKILYHWRIVPGSTSGNIQEKQYAIEAGRKAIMEALKRRKLEGKVTSLQNGTYVVSYKVPNAKVTIIIPTKDQVDLLKKCIDSIYQKSKYKDYDLLIVNNRSEKEETFAYLEEMKKKHKNFSVMDLDCPFNFSYLMNEAAKRAKGDYLLFLNNDTEVISPNFIEEMLGYASLDHIGMVGVKLLYPDQTIQHGGVILGIKGMAAHAYQYCEESYPYSFGKLHMPTNYSAVTAACAMIQKKKYFEVGGMDENLANNFNDVELGIRLMNAGYFNVYLGHVKLYHYESKTRGKDRTKKEFQKTEKERNYVLGLWKDAIYQDPFYHPTFSKNELYVLEKRQ